MIRDKVRENVDRLTGRIPVRVRRWASGVFQDKRTIQSAEYTVRFVMGWTLAAAKIFGEYAPFGIGFVAASGAGIGGLSAVIGLLFGSVATGGFTWATKYVAIAVLIYTASFVFKDVKFYSKAWFMPTIATVMTIFTGFVYASDSGWTLEATAFYIMEIILAGGSAYFYLFVFTPANPDDTEGSRRRVSLIIFLATVLAALSGLRIFGTISIGRSLAVIAVMTAAFKGGMTWGSVAGISFGIAMDAAASTPPYFTAAFALAGLISGVFARNSRLMFLLSYIIANAIASLWGWDSGFREAVLYEVFIASVAFMLLPASLLLTWKESFIKQDSYEGAAISKEYVRLRIQRTARAFRDIYDILHRNIESGKNDNDIAVVFDAAAETVCRKCKNSGICWQREYVSTFNVMNDVSVGMMKRGKLLAEDFPDYFRNKCIGLNAYTTAVNTELKALLQRRQYRSRLKENRDVLYDQFLEISALLDGMAEELESAASWEREAEKRIKLYLRGVDADIRCGVFRDKNGRLHIELEGLGIGDLRRQERYLDKLSAVVGKRLCEDGESLKKRRLVLLEAEPLAANVGIASMRKRGEKVNGDNGTYFKTDEGILHIILSDGMGSGDEAARDSSDALRILERFLKAGLDAETSLKILSSAMLLRADEKIGCASIDLMCVNLFSGDTRMFKYGAAPSYVKKGKSVRRVMGESLAAGLGTYGPDCARARLDSGCVAVITSDGVSGGDEDDWIVRIIEEFEGDVSKDLSRIILENATERFGCEDDMTVITINVETRE